MADRGLGALALHTWSMEETPLEQALAAAMAGGFDAMELRRKDFTDCFARGMDNDAVLELIRASGAEVCVLGVEYGFLFAEGQESRRLFSVFEDSCRNAVALGCPMLMSAPGQNVGPVPRAIANARAAAEIAAAHGLRLALEFNSQHDVINRLEVLQEIVDGVAHPACGLLLDAYHLERSGRGGRGFAGIDPAQLFHFQYSDVPPRPATQRRPTDRLLPGDGIVRWHEVFGLLDELGYGGFLSYEAPNPVLWALPPEEHAANAVARTRRFLPG